MLRVLILAWLAQTAAATQPPAANKRDACALLADADVRTVLGVTVKERRPASQQARGLLLSQCYLGTGTPRSVSIAVAGNTTSGGKTVTPRAFWRDQFHGRDERDSERTGEKRGPVGETEARPIDSLGDEAFWSGTRVAGALYVLRGDTFIRVSVGGISDEKTRIETSRRLAAAALAKLP
jgi:hypothetical protein